MSRVRSLVCRLIGHRFGYPKYRGIPDRVQTIKGVVTCGRCRAERVTYVGGWGW